MYSCHNHQLQLEMKLKSFFSICASAALLAAGTVHLRAQSLEPFNPYGIFSPSVEAWQMTRYGNLTPSLYTGAMTFSLPLYTYEDPDFTIPISLEYSFDGYRPAQHSGTVGYGWRLNAGGVITREVRGLPDEGVSPQDESYQLPMRGWFDACADGMTGPYAVARVWSAHRLRYNSAASSDYVSGFMGCGVMSDTPAYMKDDDRMSLYDMQPDLWHFNLLGHSGDFIMLEDGSIRVYNCDLPDGQVRVTVSLDTPGSKNMTFTINTGDGYDYLFTYGDWSKTYSESPGFAYDPPEAVTSWRLSRITAPNGRKARFGYSYNKSISSNVRYGMEVNGVYNNNSIDSWGQEIYGTIPDQAGKKYTLVQEHVCVPSSIVMNDASDHPEGSAISFIYDYATGDENSPVCFDNPYVAEIDSPGPQTLLKEVIVRNDSFQLVEKATLFHQCATHGTPKSFLTSVTTLNGGRWMFEYALAGYTLPTNDSQSTDHWGYWNGSSITDLRDHVRHPGTYVIEEEHTEMTPDSIEVHIPAVYGETRVAHLYDQMADNAKEASAYYSQCGAMTRVVYPAGGDTRIMYEGNRVTRRMNALFPSDDLSLEYVDSSDHSVEYSVGGVRVAALTDADGSGHTYQRTFEYENAEGNGSGLLMRMPKYVEDAKYVHRAENGSGSINCNALISLRAFCIPSAIQQGRDAHIAYPSVKEAHPDGSCTVYGFLSDDDTYASDLRAWGGYCTKRMISMMDWIEPYEQTPYRETFITVDRSAMRGRLVSEITLDASGREVRRCQTAFSGNGLTIGEIGHNGKYYYHFTGLTVVNPRQTSRVETVHGVTTSSRRTYNEKGQVTMLEQVTGNGSAADTVRTYYRYLWEADSTAFPAGVGAAVRTRVQNGTEYVTAAESYAYGDYHASGNTKPTEIMSYPHSGLTALPSGAAAADLFAAALSGTPRPSAYTYDTSFRLTAASLPGGASLAYTWDGHNPVTRTENGGASYVYIWRDLVGPTDIVDPSGMSTGYGYDAGGRLNTVSDAQGHTVTKYDYKLIND